MPASPLSPLLKVLRCSPSNPDPAISEAMIEAPVEAGEKLSPLAKYISTRDEALLVLNDGVTPTWFHIKRLPAAWLAGSLDQIYPRSLQRIMAFRAGCHAIEGAPEQTLSVLPPRSTGTFVATKADFGVTLAPEAWAQEVADAFGAEVVQEMGELIITHSRLRRGAQGPFGSWGESVASR